MVVAFTLAATLKRNSKTNTNDFEQPNFCLQKL